MAGKQLTTDEKNGIIQSINMAMAIILNGVTGEKNGIIHSINGALLELMRCFKYIIQLHVWNVKSHVYPGLKKGPEL